MKEQDAKLRCPWSTHDLYHAYHDEEWGRPLHDERTLFELLILEGMQAGLSWDTILKKRENFRRAFDGFDVAAVTSWPRSWRTRGLYATA